MKQRNLTQGHVFQTISVFALPMLLGNLLQQMYNVVDTWVVGKYIGAGALAGVGSAYTLMVFLTSIILGLCMGSGVVFSLYFGRKDQDRLKETVGTAFILIALASAFLTILPALALDGILVWLTIPQNILQLTHDYLFIVFLGIPAVNIALDLLFVISCGWGDSRGCRCHDYRAVQLRDWIMCFCLESRDSGISYVYSPINRKLSVSC